MNLARDGAAIVNREALTRASRLLLAAMTSLLLVGCWPDARPRPIEDADAAPSRIQVFDDGFHSSLVIPEELCPVKFQDDTVQDRSGQWVEFGFSDLQWATHQTRSPWHILRLLLVPSQGAIVIQYHTKPGRSPLFVKPRVCYDVELTPMGSAALQEYLTQTLDISSGAFKSSEFPDYWLVMSSCDYQLRWNCHDYTARALRRIGLPMRHDLFRTSGTFNQELAEVMAAYRQAGSGPIGPDRIVPPRLP